MSRCVANILFATLALCSPEGAYAARADTPRQFRPRRLYRPKPEILNGASTFPERDSLHASHAWRGLILTLSAKHSPKLI
jgi:hypothetical protein